MRLLCHVQEGKSTPYPDMKLYQEILFLKHYFKGKYVVENVISYYDPLIKPFLVGNHYYWSNFIIPNFKECDRMIIRLTDKEIIADKQKRYNIDLSKYKINNLIKKNMLNNCVEPETARHIFNYCFKSKQETLL